jgi:hypothetical protein
MYFVSRVALIRSSGHHSEVEVSVCCDMVAWALEKQKPGEKSIHISRRVIPELRR